MTHRGGADGERFGPLHSKPTVKVHRAGAARVRDRSVCRGQDTVEVRIGRGVNGWLCSAVRSAAVVGISVLAVIVDDVLQVFLAACGGQPRCASHVGKESLYPETQVE